MSKLPNIFRNNGKFITNNKNSFVNYQKRENNNNITINEDKLINYFNKRIDIILKSGEEITGVLISKRNNHILLDTNKRIDIKDIMSIK